MASDVMSVRLWLPRVEVLGVIVDAPEELVVRVRSTVRRPRCADCGTPSGKAHDRRDREIRDLEISGRPVTLIWERRRMVCDVCDRRFMEGPSGVRGPCHGASGAPPAGGRRLPDDGQRGSPAGTW